MNTAPAAMRGVYLSAGQHVLQEEGVANTVRRIPMTDAVVAEIGTAARAALVTGRAVYANFSRYQLEDVR